MRIAFAGTPEVAIPSLAALLDAGHDVVAVITRPDAPAGRGRTLAPSPVARFAQERSLPVLKPARLADIVAELQGLALESVAIVAYGGLVPVSMLGIPRHGWVNLHFSLLPAWRGAAPVQRAIMAGDDITGACTFRLEGGLDTGPVYGVITREIGSHDTAGSLLEALSRDGAQLLAQTITSLPTLVPLPQSNDGISLAPKIDKFDARIVWKHPALVIDRRIRGCTPEPGAWSEIAGQRMVIAPVSARPDVRDLLPGAVRAEGRVVLVGSGSYAVELDRVKPAGRAWMDADAWWRGARLNEGFVDAD